MVIEAKALTGEQTAQTLEEKVWVVNTLLKRQVHLSRGEAVDAVVHDVQLALIGKSGEFVKVNRLDEMTKQFSEMQISNIHIRHFTGEAPTDGDVGPYAFTLSSLLGMFANELLEYNSDEKIRQGQSLGMFLVFMVKDSFIANFDSGVKLASWFLGILSGLPGMETVRDVLTETPSVSLLSSADVARYLFRYTCGETNELPDDEIVFLLMKKDESVLEGMDAIIDHFKDGTNDDKQVGVSCHFVPYTSTEDLPSEMVRLSDMIVTVAAMCPEQGKEWTALADNMMGLLYHVCNSNLKGVRQITPTELQATVMTCKRYMKEQRNKT